LVKWLAVHRACHRCFCVSHVTSPMFRGGLHCALAMPSLVAQF
jgi:hypothetical protein